MKKIIGVLLSYNIVYKVCMTYKDINYEEINTNKKIVFQLLLRTKLMSITED